MTLPFSVAFYERYQIAETLGEGGVGTVYGRFGRDTQGRPRLDGFVGGRSGACVTSRSPAKAAGCSSCPAARAPSSASRRGAPGR